MEKWVNTPYGSCKFLIARSFLYFIVLCLCLEPPIISLYSHQNGEICAAISWEMCKHAYVNISYKGN